MYACARKGSYCTFAHECENETMKLMFATSTVGVHSFLTTFSFFN